ncbi:DUF4276 family protein [Lujinxingia sediminis]|uniref:DUF4276 family protein n=1 Tax=Lujinxingia sediminis TaxID=2480984 RepID=A0ABY0CUQ1_9DELT|nr:DUF4276 family protein [Lujinxingia sediminis]RVU45767.1 DUF4276 family protein [Lujinxingia sediminis]
MTRVCIICEGQTEETFVNDVLVRPFAHRGVYLSAALIGKPGHKGGRVNLQRLTRDLRAILGDPAIYCTTFFDFYGLPADSLVIPQPDRIQGDDWQGARRSV